MTRITLQEAAAWAEPSKMSVALQVLDTTLLDQLESEILPRLQSTVDTTTWTDAVSTPQIVRTLIAKTYVSWLIDRQYSEDEDLNSYAARLMGNADMILAGIIDGSIEIPGIPTGESGMPSFYPNDNSSASAPTYYDRSLGPAAFSMGQIF
jgi:hypothetical protein